jgi:hypothetical protein
MSSNNVVEEHFADIVSRSNHVHFLVSHTSKDSNREWELPTQGRELGTGKPFRDYCRESIAYVANILFLTLPSMKLCPRLSLNRDMTS